MEKRHCKGAICKISLIFLLIGFYLCGYNNSYAATTSNESKGNNKEAAKLREEIGTLLDSAQSLEKVLSLVAEVVKPAVVSITSIKVVQHPSPFSGGQNPHGGTPFDDFFDFFGGEDFFNKLFRDRFPNREFREQGLGSGVIVDKDGYILTNNHVVQGADEIKVFLGDKREFDAKVIGADPQSDIAVIKIEGTDLPVVEIGNSDELKVGQWAMAIGNPFGLSQTVSVGIISATGRANIGIAQYEDMIQTDAAINPGNSGGPLVNIEGKVIGINTAIFTRSGGYQGIGFAIPINMAKVAMNSLIEKGRVIRGWLGVIIQDLTPSLIKQFGASVTEGVLISDVQPNSPASEAGLKSGDIIIEFDGKKVRDVNHLRNIVAQTEIDKTVSIIAVSDGKEKDFKVKIQEQPADLFAAAGHSPSTRDLGFTVQNLTSEIAKSLGLSEVSGVVVTEVMPGSPAALADIREGDLIKEVNRQKVNNVDEFGTAIRSADKEILLLVKRGDYTRYVVLKIKKE